MSNIDRQELMDYADDICRYFTKLGLSNFSHYTIKGNIIKFYFIIDEEEKCYAIDGEIYKNFINAMPFEVASYIQYFVDSKIEMM